MLSRSQLNQENPTHQSTHHPTKTPSRQQQQQAGPSKLGQPTGGKGLGCGGGGTTAKGGRVLGAKDGNLGRAVGGRLRESFGSVVSEGAGGRGEARRQGERGIQQSRKDGDQKAGMRLYLQESGVQARRGQATPFLTKKQQTNLTNSPPPSRYHPESLQLFKDASSTSSCSSAPAPATTPAPLLSPPPSRTALPPHLRTPSPAVHKMASLSFLSPDVEFEMEGKEELMEEDAGMELDEEGEREVEYAGASAADYVEPYDPGFEMFDFRNGRGAQLMTAFPISNEVIDLENWKKEDERDRKETKFDLEVNVEEKDPKTQNDDTPEPPLFPLPRRRALAPKSSNLATINLPTRSRSTIPTPSTSRPSSAFIRPSSSIGVPTRPAASNSLRKSIATNPASNLGSVRKLTTSTKPAWGQSQSKPLSQSIPTSTSSSSLSNTRKAISSSTILRPKSVVTGESVDQKEEGEKALGVWGVQETDWNLFEETEGGMGIEMESERAEGFMFDLGED